MGRGGYALIVAVLLSLGSMGWFMTSLGARVNVPADDGIYVLRSGSTINEAIHELESQGVLTGSALAMRLYARITRSRGHFKAGEYLIQPGMTAAELVALFRSGRVVQREVTFVEGWTLAQWRDYLTGIDTIRNTLEGLDDQALMDRIGKPGLAAEGQFFPDTYHYTAGDTDLSILRRAHQRMTDTLKSQWRKRTSLDVLPGPQEALILASIVEKETGKPSDRPLIAGVFVNRLVAGMRLQSDPTVIYGLMEFDGDLRRADLRRESPYNTYLIEGLPPTPICNPGLDAIASVMNPQAVPYYYFVARGDGSSQFSVTLQEHNDAVARYQKAGRVSP